MSKLVIYYDGTKCWINKNGKFHRDNDKPAQIYKSGTKYWFKNGKFHRDNDKPALIYSDGSKYWNNIKTQNKRLLGYADKRVNNYQWWAIKLLKDGNSIRIIRLFNNLYKK